MKNIDVEFNKRISVIKKPYQDMLQEKAQIENQLREASQVKEEDVKVEDLLSGNIKSSTVHELQARLEGIQKYLDGVRKLGGFEGLCKTDPILRDLGYDVVSELKEHAKESEKVKNDIENRMMRAIDELTALEKEKMEYENESYEAKKLIEKVKAHTEVPVHPSEFDRYYAFKNKYYALGHVTRLVNTIENYKQGKLR